ncbi:hypothetical protein HYH02_005635 [Chlamydomonas schloesseri]|uniref:Uncharacterized protein n=1 Tax=Chlamydomonas schloesseri TaxID=2026947 RepID=A0A835WM34_9CHLO|nr:hypothetical protein HYH02_005635 [Chlamydomonas schloesseri]|eukprot:KAG2449491.1 hypothetical protein HYH02_005635 [Chlamydomonas schloesseri]
MRVVTLNTAHTRTRVSAASGPVAVLELRHPDPQPACALPPSCRLPVPACHLRTNRKPQKVCCAAAGDSPALPADPSAPGPFTIPPSAAPLPPAAAVLQGGPTAAAAAPSPSAPGAAPASSSAVSQSATAAPAPAPPSPPGKAVAPAAVATTTPASAAASGSGAAAGAAVPPITPNSELVARRRQRVTAEIIEASRRAGVKAGPEAIRGGLDTLEALLPGFTPNLDTLKAADWGRLAADAPAVAAKIILLKTHHPGLDLAKALTAQPRRLLQSPEQLQRSAKMVRQLLSRAKDPDRLLGAVPSLLEPKALISVLITVTKWYFLEKDPIEVLEADPELVQRAQDYDVPFEPVYMNEDGTWTAPLLNYKEKRTEWQKYIDQTFYKQP